MITLDYQDKVMIVNLNRGVINALNLELVNRLSEVFKKAKNDPDVHGLVLGSSNEKFFCIGFDIPGLYDLDRGDFAGFFQAFNHMCLELYTLPKPTTAAITGHATAGGCILALCCDYRLIAQGKKSMGLNEIKLGVPIPYLADCILRSIVGVRYARDIMESGDFYQPGQSLQMGLVDQVLPVEQVRSQAVEKVRLTGSMDQLAYALIKRNRVESIEAQFLACWQEKQESFIQCWYSPQARQKLKEAIEKF